MTTPRSARPTRAERRDALLGSTATRATSARARSSVRIIGPVPDLVEHPTPPQSVDEPRSDQIAGPARQVGARSEPVEGVGSGHAGRPRYLPALDGLRVVAVVAVVAFHLGRLGGGFLGVDVFFVLSGFLITRLLLAERASTGRISLRDFWKRRIRRLVPAVLAVLPVVAILSKLWLPSWRLSGIRDDALATLFYVANWRFVASGQSYFTDGVAPSPLRHTWSLAVEEQFYVLWPLLVLGAIALARRRRRVTVAVAAGVVTVASAAWMAWLATHGDDLTRVYYGTDSRIFAMAIGAVVATFLDPWRDRVEAAAERDGTNRALFVVAALGGAALAGLVVAFVLGREDEVGFYRGGFQVVAVLAALVVAGLAVDRGPVVRVLGSSPLRWIGQRSYSIYLWSWPVQILARARLDWLTDWRFDVLVAVATLLCASASYALVERPVLAGRWPFQVRDVEPGARRTPRPSDIVDRRWTRPAATFASVAVVAGLLVGTAAGAPPPPDYLSVDDAAVADQALSTDGFATGPAAARPPSTAPSTTRATDAGTADASAEGTATTVPEDVAVPPLDPGPSPPFDPAAPVVVEVADDLRPSQIFERPLRVVLLGDSVGWSLGWQLGGQLLPEVDLQLRALIGCGSISRGARWGIEGGGWHDYNAVCADQEEAERLGLDAGPDVVVMWIGAWEVFDQTVDGRVYEVGTPEYAERVQADVQRRVDEARARGIPLVLPVVPCFGVSDNPVHNERRRDTDAVAWVNRQIRAVAEHNPGWVRLVDPSAVLCDAEGEAVTVADGLTIRHDGSHFDRAAAGWFWDRWLGAALASSFRAPTSPT